MSSPLLPISRKIFWDDEMVKNNLQLFLRNLVNDLGNMYTEIASAFNAGPEYESQGARPTPAAGQLLIWRDLQRNKRWLLYNDNGIVVEVELTR